MVRQSLIAAVFAFVAVTAATGPSEAATSTPHHRTVVVHHVYTYEPAPNAYYYYYYGPYYGPSYAPAYGPGPVAPVVALLGAAVCLAFSLICGC
jgi:hypothetical protein